MIGNHSGDEHALVKLRSILGISQRKLLEGFSGPYIGSVERGKAKVSTKLSGAIRAKYGAYIQPGYGATDVYEAFGSEWEQSQHCIERLQRGPVVLAGRCGDSVQVEARLTELSHELAGNKSVHDLYVMEGGLKLNAYGEDSYRRFKKHRAEQSLPHASTNLPKQEQQKLAMVQEILIGLDQSAEQKLTLYSRLKEALDLVIKDLGIEGMVREAYETRLLSIGGVFPEYTRDPVFRSHLLGVAGLDAFHHPGVSKDRESIIDSMKTPVSFEYARDWSAEGMDAGTWQYLYHQTCDSLEGKR